MTILDTALDPYSASWAENRKAMLACLDEVATALDQAREGGGERYVTRHHARGKLLPRERIELLVDQDSPFLELSPVAAWGTDFPVGASVVTGIGVVCGVLCVVVANDPTVRGGAVNPYTTAKIARAEQIAGRNRLPLIHLIESGGLPASDAVLGPSVRATDVPKISVVLGDTTGDTGYLPARYQYTIMVRNRARVFLAGPPLVRLRSDDEALGGAALHATRTGLADFLAEDERDALRLVRLCVRRCGWLAIPRAARPAPPRHDAEGLLAVPSADVSEPFDPREVLARILDGSEFDEFKPAYGEALVTGWGELHGHPVCLLAHTGRPLTAADGQKAVQFIGLAAAPLVVLENAAGCASFSRSPVEVHPPHIAVTIGAWPGPGDHRLAGPRYQFSWPNARPAGEPAAAALARSGRVHDDGVIDPRDTRTVLGLCLSTLDKQTGEER